MSDSLFTPGDQPVVEQPIVSTAPVVPPELQELVGDGKKYKTVDDALKSVPHAQKHISTLEADLALAREELTKRRTTEELLADIQKGVTQQGATPPNVDLSQEVVTNIVKTALKQEKQIENFKTNVQGVVSAFNTAFGDKGEEQYNKLAQTNNLTIAQLNDLAKTSPQVVLKLAGLQEQPTRASGSPMGDGNINTQALGITTQNKNTISAKVSGTTTKDLMDAWSRAGEIVKNQQQG